MARKRRRPNNGVSHGINHQTIGRAADLIGVSQATLRLWESYGLVTSTRTSGGYRLYSPKAITQLARIQQLRNEGVNLAGIQSILAKEGGQDARRNNKTEGSDLPGERHIGRHIRQLRQSGGISIHTVAEKSGLSPSFISLVERGMVGASANSLEAICRALGSDLKSVLGLSSEGPRKKIPADERRRLPSMDPGTTLEQLAEGDIQLDCQFFTVDPGRHSDGSYAHEGEEFIFVLEGVLEVTIDQYERYQLRRGDSLYFKSTSSHSWRNPGRRPVRGIWINTGKTS